MRPDRATVRRVRTVVVASIAGAGLTVILRAADQGVAYWYLPLLFAAVTTVAIMLRWTLGELEPVAELVHGAKPEPRRPLDVLTPIEQRFAGAANERGLFLTRLQPTLIDLVRERLRHRHRLDLDTALVTDPDTVRRILGEELWEWTTTRVRQGRPPTREQLTRLVTAIEQL